MTGFVREAGGFGDILCVGAAAQAFRKENPHEAVVLFVPEEFVGVARRLEGPSGVHSLGPLKLIQDNRRVRDSALDIEKHPYLKPLQQYPFMHIVDMYCPPYAYESSHPDRLELNRCQLFAMAAGVKNIKNVRPEWLRDPAEDNIALDWIYGHGLIEKREIFGVQFRGTCAARSLSLDVQQQLLKSLSELGGVIFFDCIDPPFKLPEGVVPCIGAPIPAVACLVDMCTAVLTVDSLLLHLAAALDIPALVVSGPTDGEVAAQTYLKSLALDGEGDTCKLPCSYNPRKGWSRECRRTGCERMLSHSSGHIIMAFRILLATFACRKPVAVL